MNISTFLSAPVFSHLDFDSQWTLFRVISFKTQTKTVKGKLYILLGKYIICETVCCIPFSRYCLRFYCIYRLLYRLRLSCLFFCGAWLTALTWTWDPKSFEPLTCLQSEIKMKWLVIIDFFCLFAALNTKKCLQVALIFFYLPSDSAGPLPLFGKLD